MATDPVVIVGAATGIVSAVLVVSASVILWRRTKDLEEQVEKLSRRQKRVREVENKVLAKNPSYDEFEEIISDLAERLFSIAKSKYGLEGVTTYEEIEEDLQEVGEERKLADDMIDFFQKIQDMKYSEEDLSEAEKALIRQSAYNLIRRVEPGQEG